MSENLIRYGMKRKSIKKRLDAKLKSWLDSITDEDVKKLAQRDTIVTGGSIASMLLGEKVNDFDVYFKTKETVIAVANYYVKQFNAAKQISVGEGVVEYAPYVKEITETNYKGVTEDRVVIHIKSAGVAGIDQETYQYFEMQPTEVQEEFMESLQAVTAEDDNKYTPIFLSENAITLSGKMQIVIRFFGSPEEIHNNYDFAHAMNYYDYDADSLVLKLEALESLMSRTLIYRGSLYPICSMIRVRKFMNRGWRVSAGQLLKIAFQISELDLTDREILRQQLTGVDQAYFHQLLTALKDTDPELINSAYVAEIIDRVFGEN